MEFENGIICGDCVNVLRAFPDGCVDLVVTSPPYDEVRDYDGYSFDFNGVAKCLFRVVKSGGVVVWVVDNTVVGGGETGTAFRHALGFIDTGFTLHDTMIYLKNSFSRPSSNRCHQVFEYMFVFSKGSPTTFNKIKDRPVAYKRSGTASIRQKDGSLKHGKGGVKNGDYGGRFNVWRYKTGLNNSTKDRFAYEHPAIYPEELARDHIYTWSNWGEVVLDPFLGSGTTAKMAALMGRRYVGIEVSEKYCEIAKRRVGSCGPALPAEHWISLFNPKKNSNKKNKDVSIETFLNKARITKG